MIKIILLVLGLASLIVGTLRGNTYRLANEAAATTRSAGHWKRKAAMAIGKPDLADGDDETLEAAHDAHMQMANAMANEEEDMPLGPSEVANELTEARKESAGLLIAAAIADGRVKADAQTAWEEKFTADYNATKAALANEKKPADESLANEEAVALRKENADLQIANALTAGRILPAEKKVWEEKFAKDYDGTKVALANEKAIKIKTKPTTTNLGGANADAIANEEERRNKVHSLVNEEMGKNGGDYDKAFDFVQTKHKDLFAAMKKPAAKS